MKRHCRKFEKHSVYNLCDMLNKWIREEGRKSNRDAYLKHTNFLFQTLDPIFGQRTIVNARVHPKKGVRVNRQYEMKQRFEELTRDGLEQMDDEIDTNRNNERVNFVIPLYGRNDPFLRFVENFKNVALKTKENVSFLVMFFRDGKKLGLSDSKTYCMGGPGVIMSRATLAKVAPNLSYCLKNLYTSHEDTELGRCINQFVNVSCTRSSEVSDVLTF